MLKKILRKEYLEKRQNITATQKSVFDRRISDKIMQTAEYKSADIVAGFYPFGSEPDIVPVLKNAMENKILLLPVCMAQGIMEFRRITSFEQLTEGTYNIPEPDESCPVCDVADIDFMLVPGLVFDKAGNRIGYGGGYYDRIICRLKPDCITCGIGYSFQYVSELPAEDYDMKIKKFISEE